MQDFSRQNKSWAAFRLILSTNYDNYGSKVDKQYSVRGTYLCIDKPSVSVYRAALHAQHSPQDMAANPAGGC